MSQNPRIKDLDSPISLLLKNRPYTLSADGNERIFCFRLSETIAVLQLDGDDVSNKLMTFADLALLKPPFIVRLPGVAGSRLARWHLTSSSVSTELALEGVALKRNRSDLEFDSNMQDDRWDAWLDSLEVPLLNSDFVRQRIFTQHTFNLQVQQFASAPLIGRPPCTTSLELKLKSILKRDVDLDLSPSQAIYVVGIIPIAGTNAGLANWTRQYFAQIVLPEMLNLGHYTYDKFTRRLQNVIMQIDNLVYQTDLECKEQSQTSGCGLAIAIYIPDALSLVSIVLGDAAISVHSTKDGSLFRYTVSPSAADPGESSRVKTVEFPTALGVSRGLGIFHYKKSGGKDYSRAYGTISACPEVSIQRLSKDQEFWVCCSRSSQLQRTKLENVGKYLAAQQSSIRSIQTIAQTLGQECDIEDLILAKLCPDSKIKY